MYINDLEEGVASKMLTFSDDTRVFRKRREMGINDNLLQVDIDKLITWSEKWQILFNFEKCKCLHGMETLG